MSALDFPTIADPEPARTAVAVAVAASTNIDLSKIDLTDVALAQFGDWRGAVAVAETRLKNVAWDLTTPKGFADIKAQRNTVAKQPRADANKIADALVSKLTSVSKEVRAEQKRIVEAWDGLAAPLTVLIDAKQFELDEAARLAEVAHAAIEAARKAKHEENIATIRAYLHRCQDDASMTSVRVANGIAVLSAQTYGPDWEEFAVKAANAQFETLDAMRVLQARLLVREQEAAQIELQRQENARVAKEQRQVRAQLDAEREAFEKQREAARQTALSATAAAAQSVPESPAVTDTIYVPAHIMVSHERAPTADARSVSTQVSMFTLTALAERLGFVVGEKLLAELGIESDMRQEESILYAGSKFQSIKTALIRHNSQAA